MFKKIPALWLVVLFPAFILRNPPATHNGRWKRMGIAVLFIMPELEESIIPIIKRVDK